MNENDILKLKREIKKLDGKIDWQKSKVYNFEFSLFNNYDSVIYEHDAKVLTDTIAAAWGLEIISLFPEFNDADDHAQGWAVKKHQGVIQIPPYFLKSQYIIHECSHVIVECLKLRPPFKRLSDTEHGPLWCAVYCYNMKFHGHSPKSIKKRMEKNNIKVLDLNLIKKLHDYMCVNPPKPLFCPYLPTPKSML